MTAGIPHVRPTELAERRSNEPESLVLLDVREPFELEMAAIPDAVHIPLSQIPDRVEDLPKDKPVVVFCHHGMRSLQAAAWLRQHGVDAINLHGGIDAYARDVDPDVGTY